MKCEMCFKTPDVKWVCVDESYETELCDQCIKDLKKSGIPVEELNV